MPGKPDDSRQFVEFLVFFTNKTPGLIANDMDVLPNILTCMSRRVMKPLPSMSQIWKNSLVFSSTALQSLSLGVPCLSSPLWWDARSTLEPQVLEKEAMPSMCVCVRVCVCMCVRTPLSSHGSALDRREERTKLLSYTTSHPLRVPPSAIS